MSKFKKISDKFSEMSKSITNSKGKEGYLVAAVVAILVLYSAFVAPNISPKYLRLADNPLVKLLVFLVVVFTAKDYTAVSVIIAVSLLVSISSLRKAEIDHNIVSSLPYDGQVTTHRVREHMFDDDSPNNLVQQEFSVPEESVTGIHEEVKDEPLPYKTEVDRYYSKKNNFYPQYVNMTNDVYKSKNNVDDGITGFESDSKFANI